MNTTEREKLPVEEQKAVEVAIREDLIARGLVRPEDPS